MLKSISIPASLAAPRINPFRWNNYLESFKGMGATPDGKGWVMNNCLVAVARAAEPGFNIPSSVTEIGPYAFWECKIVEMIIPDGVQKIGNSAFGGCTSLKSVSLPKGWTTIVDHMFYYCSQLEIINGIDCVEEIGRAGLSGCKALLKRFKVPSSVKKLAEASLAAEGLSIIEFQSLTPPHLYSSLVSDQNGNYSTGIFSPFGDRTTVYVPDIAYERYHSKYYGWDQIPSRKLSDLYNTPVFTLREFDEWRGSAEQHIIRITEDGKDESRYHYDFIKVESGSFERKVPDDPATTLTVNITKDFYIAETEFPQWLWLDIMHCNPSYYTDGRAGEYGYGEGESDFRPVECISWTDCNAFLSELGKLTGLNLRLPTEAEWEYAARGGKYSNGFAYSGYNSYSYQNVYFTFPCGFGVQNELGLYEMTGNVWEYCCDRYQFWGDAGTVPSGDDPIGPTDETLTNHVIRGGGFSYQGYSYYDRETGQRIEDGFIGSQANRSAVWDERSSDMVGFRPAL
jgi:formylglycine-generating enzyme required for sulfatase activity